MKKDITELVKNGKIRNVPIITGADKDGKPIKSDKKSNLFEIDLTAELNRKISVEAKDEAEARSKVAAFIEEETVQAQKETQ